MSDLNRLLRATLEIYAAAIRQSTGVLLRHFWIIGLIPAYTLALQLVASLAAPLGFAGGFLIFFAMAALTSSFLTILGECVAHQRIGWETIPQSFGQHLSRVISVFFLFWIVGLLLRLVIEQNPQLVWLVVAVNTGFFVVFNPVPELIYQGADDGFSLVREAAQFTRDNVFEWLLPLAIMLSPFFLIHTEVGLLVMARFGAENGLTLVSEVLAAWTPENLPARSLLSTALASILIAWAMLFRGFLYQALARSGRRQRIFASRARQ